MPSSKRSSLDDRLGGRLRLRFDVPGLDEASLPADPATRKTRAA
jgi:hypothetical protein